LLLALAATPVVVTSAVMRLRRDDSVLGRWRAWKAGATYLGSDGVIRQQRANDCGTAALLMVLRRYGLRTTKSELDRAIPIGPRGVSLLALEETARTAGLRVEGWWIPPSTPAPPVFPAVLFVNGDHFVVASRRFPDGDIEILDPAIGGLKFSPTSLRRHWSGHALFFCRDGPDSCGLPGASVDPGPGWRLARRLVKGGAR